MLNEAVEFATKAHEGQFRKGTKRPYIVHPIEVADIVTTMTRDPEVICAAVLHDTIEDCAGVTKETLEDRFGERVAMLVDCESEDKSKSWEERKSTTTIHQLQQHRREVQINRVWRISFPICAIFTGIIRCSEKISGCGFGCRAKRRWDGIIRVSETC